MAEGNRWVELAEGDEFAGHRIEGLLGRGGMGVLYLAVEPGLERRVALKLIAPEAAARLGSATLSGIHPGQQRVHLYDLEALRASEAEDATAYSEARERRNDEQPERERLAEEIGAQGLQPPSS